MQIKTGASLLGLSNCRKVLIIEDSPEDFEFTTRALEQSNFVGEWHHAENGQEALDYLGDIDKSKHTDDPLTFPCLILLDLNMPKVSGTSVLKMIKNHAEFKKIPTIVLTTSSNFSDIDECYALGANSYIQKAVDYPTLKQTIGSLKNYWIDTVVLPDPMVK